ncbi:MAG: FkbM family methyltransferase [Lentisphaerae bacterium]|nr:FkbM family methyltransferase [Lentisphaerota bacterium]
MSVAPMLQSLKSIVRSLLAAAGYRIDRTPRALLRHPEAALKLTLDLVIADYVARRGTGDFFFIQVGAFNGVDADPIRKHVVARGWRGILVEPQPDVFQILSRNYQGYPGLELVNAAIADTRGKRELFVVRNDDPNLPNLLGGLASFDRTVILKHKCVLPRIESMVQTIRVPCLTWTDLLDTYRVRTIDLLQIDAEGYDSEIIALALNGPVKPRIIHFEHIHLEPEALESCFERLIAAGYRLAMEDRDTIACLPD